LHHLRCNFVLRYKEKDQVADVYFELRENGVRVAIECQNSPISSKKLMERTTKYTVKEIYVLWVFNASVIVGGQYLKII